MEERSQLVWLSQGSWDQGIILGHLTFGLQIWPHRSIWERDRDGFNRREGDSVVVEAESRNEARNQERRNRFLSGAPRGSTVLLTPWLQLKDIAFEFLDPRTKTEWTCVVLCQEVSGSWLWHPRKLMQFMSEVLPLACLLLVPLEGDRIVPYYVPSKEVCPWKTFCAADCS